MVIVLSVVLTFCFVCQEKSSRNREEKLRQLQL